MQYNVNINIQHKFLLFYKQRIVKQRKWLQCYILQQSFIIGENVIVSFNHVQIGGGPLG